MDVISAALACCLLALSSAVTQPGRGHLTIAPTVQNSDLSPLTNQTHNNNNNNNNITATVTLPNSTTDATVTSNLSGNTTPFTRSPWHNETSTRSKADTSPLQASPSTPVVTPLTNSSPLVTTTHTLTPSFTAMTPAEQTTASRTSTPDATATNSSVTVHRSSDSSDRKTQALPLNLSDHTMAILLSIVLGVLALASVLLILHKCKHKIQILHEPLDNSDDLDAFAADDDTLVISGGLYDGHPIYDNPPAASDGQSQLRLEFLQ